MYFARFSVRMKFIVASILFITSNLCSAQSAFTVKYFGLTIHPFGDPTAELQPYKLDDNAKFVMNFGGFAGYEKFFYRDLVSVKAIQGVFSDCSGGLASVTHIGPRLNLLKVKKHKIYFGIGPTLILRDSWTRFGEKYTSSGYFNVAKTARFGELQWKFIPYGLELEYDFAITERNQFSLSFTPGVPLAMIFSFGWKHWIKIKEFDPYKVYIPRKNHIRIP